MKRTHSSLIIAVILSIASIAVSISGDIIADMWGPDTPLERIYVVASFLLSAALIIGLGVFQHASIEINISRQIQRLLSPWWIVAICSGSAVLAFVHKRDFFLFLSMLTVSSISIVAGTRSVLASEEDDVTKYFEPLEPKLSGQFKPFQDESRKEQN